ncbi:MAG: sugar transferase [Lachnospiraceae bacterium]|nr:sugar transferase [Lachnospiraceae bacterium]
MLLRSSQVRRAVVLFIDIFGIFIAFIISWFFRFGAPFSWIISELYTSTLVIITLLYVVIFVFYDNKRPSVVHQTPFENLISVFTNQVLLMVLTVFYLFAMQRGTLISRYVIGLTFVIAFFTDFILRMLFRIIIIRYSQDVEKINNVMLVTLSFRAKDILQEFEQNQGYLMRISCITILDKDMVGRNINGIPVVGNEENFLYTHRQNVFDEVFVNIPYNYEVKLRKIIMGFEEMGVTVNLNIEFNVDASEKRIRNFAGYQVVSFSAAILDPGSLFIKRLMDLVGSIVGLLICAVSIIIFGPIIKITSPGPIFFAQTRVGINGRRFKIFKLRTMYSDAEKRKAELLKQNEMNGLMFKIKDDPRITPIGKFLRKASIDELPQFWNVLIGDMSMVGTRPPTEDEYEKYGNYHMRRLSIRPGITGMWQVSGRNEINNFEDVVRLDLSYIDNWSLLLDIKIILKTVWIVIFGRGAS